MKNISIFQVDSFTEEVFGGNPAAVCPLEFWLDEDILQKIAQENNLSETAFYVKNNQQYQIRWFTPSIEVDLCGHATLAAAHVLFGHEGVSDKQLDFYSPRSGVLSVRREENGFLTLNFPSDTLHLVSKDSLPQLFYGKQAKEIWKGKTDYMYVFDNEQDILDIVPNLAEIKAVNARGIIVTAASTEVDFVSRFFGPRCGVDEDPVTGSAHTSLIPYWAKKLQKTSLQALQVSGRRGYLRCKYLQERVEISGQAKTYLIGKIFI